ncbi:hypothetical protein FOT62_24820 [Serratia marcescens]|uniref:Saf-pilin pilus formation protein domain-containing protein n=1 Tax=Serratia marcescens TaxID=615 RepID=A0A5C7BJD3_SERMA|nr:hypothetical protein [Serratia marcescens]TXE24299.1 hypothetical protein FOT62_24820 [Serratia marcescens]TXE53294.1 hypothetical protein FOT56_27280 [Serratia marcescens]
MNKAKLALMFGGLVALGASALPAHAELSDGDAQQVKIKIASVLPKVAFTITPTPNLSTGEHAKGTVLAKLDLSTSTAQMYALSADDTLHDQALSPLYGLSGVLHSKENDTDNIHVWVTSLSGENVQGKELGGKSYSMTKTAVTATTDWAIYLSGSAQNLVAGRYPITLSAYTYKE